MERPVSRSRERSAGQQRELRLTEERPLRPTARVALTSDARKKGGGSEWRSYIPDPKGLGMARGAGSREPAPKGGSKGLEGEVADSSGGQRFLGWITSRSTTPCLMRRRGRSTCGGACSRSRSWNRGVNRDPPGTEPTPRADEAGGFPRKGDVGSRNARWRLAAR